MRDTLRDDNALGSIPAQPLKVPPMRFFAQVLLALFLVVPVINASAQERLFTHQGVERDAKRSEKYLRDNWTASTKTPAELEAAGVRDEAIILLCGIGMHRPSTQAEKIAKLGAEVAARYRVIDNEPQNRTMRNRYALGFSSRSGSKHHIGNGFFINFFDPAELQCFREVVVA